ncbi:hypothetical protein BRADI_1g69466v3 [Brachypodium distachyon]|uniref:Uncharacterized protein n=1 Tax=Brachypodium distachyon TaxID=15368 RepID=A0A0Q3NYL9_BRADI|nr:hypothetical protein BRADI_1g69466v3 [Brachypodium distachyon]
MQVHANERGVTQTRDLGSSFWRMVFVLSSTHLLTTRIAAGCFILALVAVLFVAKNASLLWFLHWLCIGFIVSIGVVWVIQEFITFHVLTFLLMVTLSRRVNSSDTDEKCVEICPCPCNDGFISFNFLCPSIYHGLVILS